MSTKPAPIDPGFRARIAFVDVLRGIAVVSMIWMHTADGWLDRSLRADGLWRGIVSFGGLAAPLFFALSGVGLGIAWHGGSDGELATRLRRQMDRGLQLVVLGYALRLQMWMVDAGGFAHVGNWGTTALLLAAYVLAYRALRQRHHHRQRDLLLAALAFGSGLLAVSLLSPSALPRLLRVDVLQGLGAATCAVCLTSQWLLRKRLPLAAPLLAIALLIPFVVSPLRAGLPGPLPHAIAGYLATWPLPKGAHAATLFPLFPWMSYTFGGAGFALLWSRAHADNRGVAVLRWTFLTGLVVAALVSESQPWTYAATQEWPSLTQPVRVVYRAAVASALCLPALWLSRTGIGRALQHLGSASLWVYWVHLEVAFGSIAHPIAHSMGAAAWFFGFVALTIAMLGLSLAVNAHVGSTLLHRLAPRRGARASQEHKGPPQPVRGP